MDHIKMITIVFLVACSGLFGQGNLSVADAIEITLANNHDIGIARNTTKIAENNTSNRNSGYLPTIQFNAGSEAGFSGSEIQYNSTAPASSNWIISDIGYNAVLSASYLIYDFDKRELKKKRWKELFNIAGMEERQAIENSLYQMLSQYYTVSYLYHDITVLTQALDVSNQRLKRVRQGFEYGNATKLDVLNAEVDLNRDSIDFYNLMEEIESELRTLNVVLGVDVNTRFMVDTAVFFQAIPSYEILADETLNRNIDIILAKENTVLNDLDQRLKAKELLPSIGLSANYGLNGYLNNDIPAINSYFGTELKGGITFSWNIFDGGYNSIQRSNLKLNQKIYELRSGNIEAQVLTSLRNAFEQYQNQLFIINVEEKNIETAQVGFDRTMEQFKLGRITSLEFRQAQLNLLLAKRNHNVAKYQALQSELMLLYLSGRILEVM